VCAAGYRIEEFTGAQRIWMNVQYAWQHHRAAPSGVDDEVRNNQFAKPSVCQTGGFWLLRMLSVMLLPVAYRDGIPG
jgi:hypothetical protein